MKPSHNSLLKKALDATLEALTSPDAATDPRADESYPHPLAQKGTEPEQVKYAYGDDEFMDELRQEEFLDKARGAEREAYDAFMQDSDMQMLAAEDGISMEDLWLQYKEEYTNNYWEGREHLGSLDDLNAPPDPDTATFFKESDPELQHAEFTASLTASGVRVTKKAEVKSYGAGTPIGGTPNTKSPALDPTKPKHDQNLQNMQNQQKTQQQVLEDNLQGAQPVPGQPQPVPGQPGNPLIMQGASDVRYCAECEEEFTGSPEEDYCIGCRNKTAAVTMKETPKHLPPRDDMRRHLDEDVKKEVMDGVMDGVDKVAWVDDEDDDDDGPDGQYGTMYGKPLGGASPEVKKRLEYLRSQLRAEQISYGELAELQGLADYIDDDDVELLEAAGVEEGSREGKGNPHDPYDTDAKEQPGAYVELHCPVKGCTFTTGKWNGLEFAENHMKRHYNSWHPEKQWPPKKNYRTNKEDKDFLKSLGIKARAKNAIKTEENINNVCPNCHSPNSKTVEGSEMEDGSLVECLDCGCFFSL